MKPTREYYRKLSDSFKEVKCGELSTFSYLHGGIDFTDSRNRLARGLTLDSHDNVVLVGFEKFFCLNQLDNRVEAGQLSEQFVEEYCHLQDKDIYECLEKFDGTMVILGVYNDELLAGTTSSIDNEYAKFATDYFRKHEKTNEIKAYLKERNSCIVFEYISINNIIAVRYDVEVEFILLGEISKDTLKEIDPNITYFRRPDMSKYTLGELHYIQKTAKNFEGFVITNDYGHKVKVKTDWWYEQHLETGFFFSNKITLQNIKTVIKAVYETNTLDEMYSLANSYQSSSKVEKLDLIVNSLKALQEKARELVREYKTMQNISKLQELSAVKMLASNLIAERTLQERNYKVLITTIRDMLPRSVGGL